MRDKSLLVLLLVVGLAALLAAPATAMADEADDEAAVDKTTEEKEANAESHAVAQEAQPEAYESRPALPGRIEGAAFLGGLANGTDGILDQVGEYNVLNEQGLPRFGLSAWGNSGRTFFEIYSRHGGDAADQHHELALDFDRKLQVEAWYKALPHRLDHDPMSYLDAAIGNFVIRNTETVPGVDFRADRSDLGAKAELTIPGAEGVTLEAGFRRFTRVGHDQVLAASKCSNCHMTSMERELDRKTWDLHAGATVEIDDAILEYVYKRRDFEEQGATPEVVYDDPLHPAFLSPVFGNRIILWERDGLQPFLRVPNHSKDSHRVRARVGLPGDATLLGGFSYTSTTNEDVGIDSRSIGFKGRLVYPLKKGMSLTATVRHYDIEVDDYFVDLPEPASLAGPTAGQTFAEFYPEFGEVDFTRRSVRNRSPTEARLDWSYRVAPKTTLTAGYEFEQVERDHFSVEQTTTNLFRVGLRSRAAGNKLKFRLRGEFAWIDDPFLAHKAALPEALQLTPSPGATPFFGLQYFQMYEARQADLSARPDQSILLDGQFTWSASPRFSLTGRYRLRDLSNDSLNFSTWDRTVHSPGAYFWWAPRDEWVVTAGYDYLRDQAKTLFAVLAFDG